MRRSPVLSDVDRLKDAWIDLGVTSDSNTIIRTPAHFGNHFACSLGANAELLPPHSGHDGQRVLWCFRQVGVGSFTVTPSSAFTVVGSGSMLLASATGSVTFWEALRDPISGGWYLWALPDLSSVYEASGTAAAAVASHVALANPHSQYLLTAVAAGTYAPIASSIRTKGIATLVGGTVVVTDAGVTANSIILLTPQENGVGNGSVRVSARSAGVSFTISSTNVLDDADVGYVVWEP